MENPRCKITKTQSTFKAQEDSDEQSTDSGAMIGSNDDIVTEILLRVPATSILQFKSVSKHWQWLLSHRNFTLRYDNLSKSPGLFLRNEFVPYDVENPSPPPFVSLDFHPDPFGIRIVHSCNGLLLCCTDRGEKRRRKYYVFNPTTKQSAVIPSVPGGYKVRKNIRFMGLAFHQTDFVHYKVVCIHVMEHDRDLFQIQIYSSDTQKWKVSTGSFSVHLLPRDVDDAVYWNGAIHWRPSFRSHLYFDVEAEKLQQFPLPVQVQVESCGDYSHTEMPMCFRESRGHLHLVTITKYGFLKNTGLNVYELSSDYSGWFVKYQVELYELLDAFKAAMYWTTYYFHTIDVVRGEKEEDAFIVVKLWDTIIRYNVHDKSFKKIFTFTHHMYGRWLGHRYIELLSSF